MSRRPHQFPYEYGSDLHWLWGWGHRLDSLLRDDEHLLSSYDCMIFRPDDLARNAMMRFSIEYPHVIKQVDDYLEWTEARFGEFIAAEKDETAQWNFSMAMVQLAQRIRVAVETIAQADAKPLAEFSTNANDDWITAAEAHPPRTLDMQQLVLIVGDENAARIAAIANRTGRSGEQKMLEILQVDNRFEGKNSIEWSKLLGVTPAAVRQYETWTRLQAARRRDLK